VSDSQCDCAVAARIPAPKNKLVYAGISAYVLINALALFSLTSLWGNPAMAARYWQEQFPRSARAATTAASIELAEGRPQGTLHILRRLVEEKPAAGFVKIQELNLYCIIAPGGDHRNTVGELDGLLRNANFSYTAGTMFSQLFTTVSRGECNGVDGDTERRVGVPIHPGTRHESWPTNGSSASAWRP
jgi:hypothetical protein